MPKNSGAITITRFELRREKWEPISAPMNCNAYVFFNSAFQLRLCSDTEDPKTEMICAPGSNPSLILAGEGHRFIKGQTILFAKAIQPPDSTWPCSLSAIFVA